jgi:hypothetical protein
MRFAGTVNTVSQLPGTRELQTGLDACAGLVIRIENEFAIPVRAS